MPGQQHVYTIREHTLPGVCSKFETSLVLMLGFLCRATVGGGPGIVEGLQQHPPPLLMPGRPGDGPLPPPAQQQHGPADLSRRPCARPFLISNIMGLEEEDRRGEEEEEEEEGGASPPHAGHHHHQHLEEEGGASPGTSPGPDSGSEMGMGDEDSIAKVRQ